MKYKVVALINGNEKTFIQTAENEKQAFHLVKCCIEIPLQLFNKKLPKIDFLSVEKLGI